MTKKEEKLKNIELRSEEVQDILGKVPNWLIRRGTQVVFIIIILLLFLSWLFRYPDIINSKIIITTTHPPASVIAYSTGKIERFFVKDKQIVQKGDLIALIENSASFNDVIYVKNKLDILEQFINNFDNNLDISLQTIVNIGENQMKYAQLVRHYKSYIHFLSLDEFQKKIEEKKKQIKRYNELYAQQKIEKNMQGKELLITKRELSRDLSLYTKKVIARSEYQTSQKKYIQVQYSFENIKTQMKSTKINLTNLYSDIHLLQIDYELKKNSLQLQLTESFNQLLSQLSEWRKKYVVKSPIAGTVTFTKYWSANQNITVGEEIVSVVPYKQTSLIGKVELPIAGSGKVNIGNTVNIKFANYPYLEYGIVKGEVTNISLVPNNQIYTVEVNLTNGLRTIYGNDLPFGQKIEGKAEIITENLRLIERIIFPVKYLMTKQQ